MPGAPHWPITGTKGRTEHVGRMTTMPTHDPLWRYLVDEELLNDWMGIIFPTHYYTPAYLGGILCSCLYQ
jgi:hypothetical protein